MPLALTGVTAYHPSSSSNFGKALGNANFDTAATMRIGAVQMGRNEEFLMRERLGVRGIGV